MTASDFRYKHEDQMRFVFVAQGKKVGLTQDRDLVAECLEDGLYARDYERTPGVQEWEVFLGDWPVNPDSISVETVL